ncbi:galactoside 2-alpha-l-fucosyltransferase [Quercus suber]|uniref:Fucosyltransferase n=1 Tax=Quercus suber TaxID=58331 RepID=A0AAW0LGR4_QUESU
MVPSSEDVSSQFTEMPKDKLLGGLLASGFDKGSCLSSGLGNRILTLTSTFLYALLTNRALLVDQGMDMADLFYEPFPEKSWFLPVDFPLKETFKILNRKRTIVTQSEKGNLKAILKTSLSSGYFENVRNMYWEYPTVNGDVVEVFQQS